MSQLSRRVRRLEGGNVGHIPDVSPVFFIDPKSGEATSAWIIGVGHLKRDDQETQQGFESRVTRVLRPTSQPDLHGGVQ